MLPHARIRSVDLIWPWILIRSPDQARSFPSSLCPGATDFCLRCPFPFPCRPQPRTSRSHPFIHCLNLNKFLFSMDGNLPLELPVRPPTPHDRLTQDSPSCGCLLSEMTLLQVTLLWYLTQASEDLPSLSAPVSHLDTHWCFTFVVFIWAWG